MKIKSCKSFLTFEDLKAGEVFREINSITAKCHLLMKIYDPYPQAAGNLAINLETGTVIIMPLIAPVERVKGVFMEGEED